MSARPVAIRPAPTKAASEAQGTNSADSTLVPYACQTCARRKIRCDRVTPLCSSCSKGKLECVYQDPQPRRPKRKRDESVHDRLARYERTLQENGLLSKAESTLLLAKNSPPFTPESTVPPPEKHPETSKTGRLLSGKGKARYIDGNLWPDLEGDEMQEMSEESDDGQCIPIHTTSLTEHALSSALLGVSQDLVNYHPGHNDAMKLWAVYVQNVEPVCKVLHIPTTARMVEQVSQQPTNASKSHECLLFAVYHFAVFSMTDEDCLREFGQSQAILMSKYQDAVRQALINASWLRTTEMSIMQAFVLFLIAVRTQIDRHTFWILTGVAVRIAQRMGLHRDGENLGLPPFEVEIRRRLFWQLLPLDGFAGGVSGTGISIAPSDWDTKQPRNINDDQIYPGVTQQPEERKGATEMMYFLARSELSKLYTRTGVRMKDVGAVLQLKDRAELEKVIDEVVDIIESKYLRYCDIMNPLHFLTFGTVRSAASAMRLRSGMPQLMSQTINDQERSDLCVLAQKVLDTDSSFYSNPKLKKFQWSIKGMFIWDALICILTSISKPGFLSRIDLDAAWSNMADVYANHQEILEGKRAFHIAVGRATLKAWTVNPPSYAAVEPGFITALRELRHDKIAKRPKNNGELASKNTAAAETVSSFDFITSDDPDALFGDIYWTDLNLGSEFNLDTADWMFWD